MQTSTYHFHDDLWFLLNFSLKKNLVLCMAATTFFLYSLSITYICISKANMAHKNTTTEQKESVFNASIFVCNSVMLNDLIVMVFTFFRIFICIYW